MKLAVLVLLLSAATSAMGTTHPMSEAHARGFRGNVRSVREEVAELVRAGDSAVEGPRQLAVLETYDGAGRLVSATRFVDGVATERIRYSQVDRATIAINTEYRRSETHFALISAGGGMAHRDGAGPWRSQRMLSTIIRDSAGRVIEKLFRADARESTSVARETMRYDDRGRVAETVRLAGDGSVLGSERCGYDASGTLVSLAVTSGTGEIVEQTSYDGYVFDAAGNWTRRIEHVRVGAVLEERVVYRTLSYQSPRARMVPANSLATHRYYPRAGCLMARAYAAANIAGSQTASALDAMSTTEPPAKATARPSSAIAMGNEEKSEDKPMVIGVSEEVVTVEVVMGRSTESVVTPVTDSDTDHDGDVDAK